MSALLVINDVDYTNNIRVPSWAVNSVDVGGSWNNANHVMRPYVTRKRIQGTFQMYWNDIDTYENFLEIINYLRDTDGSITVSLWCENTHEFKENIKVIMSYNCQNTRPKQYAELSITVQEL